MKKKKMIAVVALFVLGVAILSAADPDTIVYVTKSGKKYHTATCSSLSKSKIPMRLADAVSAGYEPCSRCHPPVLGSTKPQGKLQEKATLYRVNVEKLQSYLHADIKKMVLAEVVDCIDGDTIRVRIADTPAGLQEIETVRLLGVDTPETVHPNKPVERFGKEASDFTRRSLAGKPIYLAFDWDLRDAYKRLLAYVYLADGTCFNALLISSGYGFAYVKYPFQFMEEFKALERKSREQKAGLWGN